MSKPPANKPSHASIASVRDKVSDYSSHFQHHDADEIDRRRREYAQVVNTYYDLVTDFYEYGWGRHFHFAVARAGESLETALLAHEHYLAYRMHPEPGAKVLDVGCGVGGPLSTIARLTGASIVGVNINHYQLRKGHNYLRHSPQEPLCTFVHADFLQLPFADEGFDAAYAIEATCHAPILSQVYTPIFRVLKPGGTFALYEWCLTEKYDPNIPEHRHIKEEIETGNGIPSLVPQEEVDRALTSAGFSIQFQRDRALDCDPASPWYSFLSGKTRLDNFRRSEFGGRVTHLIVRVGEWLRLMPRGTSAVSSLLLRAGRAEVEGGRLGIFTPMYFVLAQKPA